MRRATDSERWPRPTVVGIVNVTPDSFSDGGAYVDADAAADAAVAMLADGAAIVDVGGESTRPGADDVSLDEELRRVVPVLERLDGRRVSIDTSRRRGRAARARARRGARQRRDRASARSRAGGRGRRLRRVAVPDAHAGRASHDAGGAALRRRRRGGGRVPRGAPRVRGRFGDRGGADLPRPGLRVREDGRPEPRAAPPARPDRRDRPSGDGRHLPEVDARAHRSEPGRTGRVGRRVGRCRGLGVRPRRDAVPRPRRALARGGAGGRRRGGAGDGGAVTIELHGIALHGFHGVLEHERREGQRFLVDVDLDLSDETAATTDRIEDAVDYREVVAAVAAVSEARAYHLLEAFATADRRDPGRALSRDPGARARAEAGRRPDPAGRPRRRGRRAAEELGLGLPGRLRLRRRGRQPVRRVGRLRVRRDREVRPAPGTGVRVHEPLGAAGRRWRWRAVPSQRTGRPPSARSRGGARDPRPRCP